jgi:hypothetical protein
MFRSCGICCGQSGSGAGFLRVFRFPLLILITLTAPGAGTIGQIVATVSSVLSLTQQQETKKLVGTADICSQCIYYLLRYMLSLVVRERVSTEVQ